MSVKQTEYNTLAILRVSYPYDYFDLAQWWPTVEWLSYHQAKLHSTDGLLRHPNNNILVEWDISANQTRGKHSIRASHRLTKVIEPQSIS